MKKFFNWLSSPSKFTKSDEIRIIISLLASLLALVLFYLVISH